MGTDKLGRIVVTGAPDALQRGLKIKAISDHTTVNRLVLAAIAAQYPDLLPLMKGGAHEERTNDATASARVDRSPWRTPFKKSNGRSS